MTTETVAAASTPATTPEVVEGITQESKANSYFPQEARDAEAAEVAAKAEAAPEKILGKFATQEDLAKAYQELEKKLGAPKTEAVKEPVAEKTADPKVEGDKPETPKEDAAPDTGNIPVTKYEAEFAAKGALSEESYKELAETYKVPKEMADEFIAYRKNTADGLKAEMGEMFGGAEGVAEALKWAGENFTDAEIAAFNGANSAATIREQAQALKVRYSESQPVEAKRVVQGSTDTGGAEAGYADDAAWQKEMRSPEFKKSEAYRTKAMAKLAASSWFRQGVSG